MSSRLYLEDPYQQEFSAEVTETADGWSAFSRTAFYPGGGGQPHDRGQIHRGDEVFVVNSLREDTAGRIWHCLDCSLQPGDVVKGVVDWPFRFALMRYHALMHVVNTIGYREFGARMTGAQLGPDRSRIDLKLTDFGRERLAEFERKVNDVLVQGLQIGSSVIDEDEYRRRPELVRTINVAPPIVDHTVRIVEIAGFDAQACGGTHVHSTTEIGTARLVKFDNKGKDNKRLYWELE